MTSHRRTRDARRAERRDAREQQVVARNVRRADVLASTPAPTPNERDPFTCGHCGERVGPTVSGGHHRNHCPHCLYSLHIDDRRMGDRASTCGGLMAPVATFRRPKGEAVIIHRCERCELERHNRLAADDSLLVLRGLPEVEPRQTVRGTPADALST